MQIYFISWHYFVCFTITYHTAIQNSTNESQGKFQKTDVAQIHTPREQADHTGSSSQATPDTNGRLIQQIANSEDWAPRTELRERAKYQLKCVDEHH